MWVLIREFVAAVDVAGQLADSMPLAVGLTVVIVSYFVAASGSKKIPFFLQENSTGLLNHD